MSGQPTTRPDDIRVTIEPGICGFPCVIHSRMDDKREVSLEITGSECKHIRALSQNLKVMTLRNLFAPVSKNPAFLYAEAAGCHPSCPVPVAILKAAEAAMEMALPRDVKITFQAEEPNASEAQVLRQNNEDSKRS